MKFRKKPVVIEAYQIPPKWNGDGVPQQLADLLVWMQAHGADFQYADDGGIDIETLEGEMHGHPGDWIIRGVAGEFYPCEPYIFAATYEAVIELGAEGHRA